LHLQGRETPWLAPRGFFCVLLAALLFAPSAFAADHADELIERARQLRLAERAEWRKLVHYVPNLASPGLHSQIDSPSFFHSPAGKQDPHAELEATLRSFFAPAPDGDDHPQCRFVARRAWLDAELGFDAQQLPRRECRRFQEWRTSIDASQLTLVFASAYVNNPASMYGHTLLRVDAADQDERTRLLAYAISFTVGTPDTSGVLFVLRGLSGGYPGVFSLLPYYLKVREYRDMENRDLWEYQLDLRGEEIERVLAHAWELLPVKFDYYFFDENCAYHLLGLLQVARPDLELTARFPLWVIPVDTVRALTEERRLVRKIVYRPSSATTIAGRLASLRPDERDLARGLALGTLAPADPSLRSLSAERAAAIVEAGHDYLSYRRRTGESKVADGGALAHELLLARHAIDAPSQAPHLQPGPRPDEGHRTARFTAGAGRRDDEPFLELGVRPAYHDLLDDDTGYAGTTQVDFFHLRARRYEGRDARIESFIPVALASLAPRDDFFQPLSWRLATGWQRTLTKSGAEPLAFGADGGVGGSWATTRATRLYAMFEGTVRVHSELEDGYTMGGGARLGAFVDPAPSWRLHLYAQQLASLAGERTDPAALVLEQRLTLARDAALRLDLRREREAGKSFGSAALFVQLYF
jgi:hypothetical protein